ncbi:MAG: hypothetical protein RIS00_1533, partial [Pseudomonadota bacterium]
SACLFFSSVFLMPLAEATAIVFVSPVITALLSAALLREPMRRAAWLATAIALAGVAIVLRPNLAELGIIALMPLIAAVFMAAMLIFNRMAAGTGSPMALQFAIAMVAAPVMIIVASIGDMSGFEPWQIGWPESSVRLRCAIVAVSASTAHWLIYLGTTRSTAADAAQAAYVQLPVALLIDALVFRHWPDAMALGGSALIVSAGLIMWQLQRNAVIAGTQR